MKPGGIIAFHLTNRFLDLIPVVKQLADAHHLFAVLVADEGDEGDREPQRLGALVGQRGFAPGAADRRGRVRRSSARVNLRLWTDDFKQYHPDSQDSAEFIRP